MTTGTAQPREQTLAFWLGRTARLMRRAAGVQAWAVSLLLQKDVKSVERFERAENWPSDLEAVLIAYGYLLDTDPREIVARAVEAWMADGEAPAFSPKEAARAGKVAALAAVEMTAHDALQAQAEAKAAPTARRRKAPKKAGGR